MHKLRREQANELLCAGMQSTLAQLMTAAAKQGAKKREELDWPQVQQLHAVATILLQLQAVMEGAAILCPVAPEGEQPAVTKIRPMPDLGSDEKKAEFQTWLAQVKVRAGEQFGSTAQAVDPAQFAAYFVKGFTPEAAIYQAMFDEK